MVNSSPHAIRLPAGILMLEVKPAISLPMILTPEQVVKMEKNDEEEIRWEEQVSFPLSEGHPHGPSSKSDQTCLNITNSEQTTILASHII